MEKTNLKNKIDKLIKESINDLYYSTLDYEGMKEFLINVWSNIGMLEKYEQTIILSAFNTYIDDISELEIIKPMILQNLYDNVEAKLKIANIRYFHPQIQKDDEVELNLVDMMNQILNK
jgi:hypothetical protein